MMSTVRGIMTRNPLSFTPETTIREAMETLCAEHVSGAPVVSGQRVVGVVSITDLLSFLVTTRDGEEESPSPFTAAWEEREEEAEDESIQERTRDSEILDDWAEKTDGLLDETQPGSRALLDQHVLEEVMTTDVVSVPSRANIKAAAALMQKHGIHRVLVIDGNMLKGIVSSLDVAGALTKFTEKAV